MGKQGTYSEQLAARLIGQAVDEMNVLYRPGAMEWARINRRALSDAVMTSFNAIDLPCDASDVQGLHAALATFRAATADLVAAYRRRLAGLGCTASAPAPPSPKEIIPMVQMIPGEEFGAQKLLFETPSGTGPLGQIGA